MSGGCFKNVFAAIGCLVVVALLGLAAWYFRAEITDAYRGIVGSDGTGSDASEVTVGRPSPDHLRSAEMRESTIAQRDGPDEIVLSADEMASLIQDRLNPVARRALDSISVTLGRDRFSLRAELLTEVFGRDLLGPLRGMIDPREPLRVSGTAEIRAPGVVAWKIDEFVVSSFPFPGPAIPLLVDRLTGGTNGVILIAVPATVGDLRIRADGVTFYRRVD